MGGKEFGFTKSIFHIWQVLDEKFFHTFQKYHLPNDWWSKSSKLKHKYLVKKQHILHPKYVIPLQFLCHLKKNLSLFFYLQGQVC